MKLFKYLVLILFAFLFSIHTVNAEDKEINIHLFYGDGCPHCEDEKEFLDEYLKDMENVNYYKYEVWYNSADRNLWAEVQELLDKPATGVPYTVIGDRVLTGFGNQTKRDIKNIIEFYQTNNYRDLVGEHIGLVEKGENEIDEYVEETDIINVPILGEIDPKGVSLAVLAIVIGFVDGFNPCAMWVLLFLISMLIGMKDRKKMWILGLTFLVTSAIVYAMFMVAWLNLAIFVAQISFVRILIGTFALVVAGINLKSYFKKKEDGCEVVNDTKRKKIIDKIKGIVKQKKFSLAIIGVIVLAASVNLVELLCSAGLPLMFTNILVLNDLATNQYAFYIFLYMLFFLIDDIIIFAIAMITFKVSGISTKYTKYSHLIGGIIMLLIGLLLIFRPDLLMMNF